MVNLVALCAISLSFLTITGGASNPGNSFYTSREVEADPDCDDPLEDRGVAAAWWAGWHPDLLPLDKVSWSKYTHMTYAFA